MAICYNMPTLHIRALKNDNRGITKVRLSNDIRSQHLRLLTAIIQRSSNSFTGDSVGVRLPFLSSDQFHSTLRRGELQFPVDKLSGSRLTVINFGQGLPLDCDHINEAFEVQLVDENGAGLTSSGNMDFVDLYFSYETASLF